MSKYWNKNYWNWLGIYPYKCKELFQNFLYSINPKNLLKAISIIFGKLVKIDNELKLTSESPILDGEILEKIFQNIENNRKFFYEDLRKELIEIELGEDIFKNFCNIEKETYNKLEGKPFNPKMGEDLEIYSKNLLKTQRILMVMLWSYELNDKEESPYVSPKYINEQSAINKISIKDTLKFLGIENDVVVDYDTAIKKLLLKDNNGNCNYYSVWIFCGPKLPIFPHIKKGQTNFSNPNLVEEFINVLKISWENGGALVFFPEGQPLNFQVNLFLEKTEFLNGEKVNFKISGNYLGDKDLEQDKTGVLNRKGVFDKSQKEIIFNGKKIKRQILSHNLGLIYEGYSIGYCVDKNDNIISFGEFEKLKPFKPFSVNSNGSITTLIYDADDKGRGDILIDCGFTKCF